MNKTMVIGAAAALVLTMSACSGSSGSATTELKKGSGSCTYREGGEAAKKVALPAAKDVNNKGTTKLTFATNEGDIAIELDNEKTPCAANSILSLANQKYFDNTKCHRLTTQGIYVLQCGDPTGTGRGGPGYRFDDELSGQEKYPAGTVAMANAGANTNGSQFFLVYADTPLPAKYTVFGKMDEKSLGVVKKISDMGVDGSSGGGGGDGKPINKAEIKSTKIG